MDDKIKPINSERVTLGKVLPLETPFTLNICPTLYCNFKCGYCIHSLDDETKKQSIIGTKMHMTFATFKKAIDGCKNFEQKLKCILFCSYGEPLLNPDIVKMVKYASDSGISERIEIVTNGYMLTNKISDELIDAGLTALRISLQGLDADSYKKMSQININYEEFTNQIKYFYNKKQGKNCTLFVKIVDAALNHYAAEIFYNTFRDFTDLMYIEHIFKQHEEVDYSKVTDKISDTKNDFKNLNVAICPYPFYSINIYADGTIHNCHERKYSTIGNVADVSVYEAWNSKSTKLFFINLLGEKTAFCKKCNLAKGLIKKQDVIDEYKNEILIRIKG